MEPTFSADWFGKFIPHWERLLSNYVGKPELRYLEVGCYEGRSLTWMMDNVLTADSARACVIDSFESQLCLDIPDGDVLYARLQRNIAKYQSKVSVIRQRSAEALASLPASDLFELIYIDADHCSEAVYRDAVLAWPHLRAGGLLIFDDYLWNLVPDEADRPKQGIDRFIREYSSELRITFSDYQVFMQKKM